MLRFEDFPIYKLVKLGLKESSAIGKNRYIHLITLISELLKYTDGEVENTEPSQDTIEKVSKIVYELTEDWNRLIGMGYDKQSPYSWEEYPVQDSVKRFVKLFLESPSFPVYSHDKWCQIAREEGWVYGDHDDRDKKITCDLVTFDSLSVKKRVRTVLFVWACVIGSKINFEIDKSFCRIALNPFADA